MGRKTKREVVGIIPADMLFDAQKPRYNPHQGKTGAHGKNKYDRNRKHKRQGEW